MKIYVVVQKDRHIDFDLEVYADQDLAIKRAKAIVNHELSLIDKDDLFDNNYWMNFGEQDLTDDAIKDGWLYHGQYSGEGDCLIVIERQLLREMQIE